MPEAREEIMKLLAVIGACDRITGEELADFMLKIVEGVYIYVYYVCVLCVYMYMIRACDRNHGGRTCRFHVENS